MTTCCAADRTAGREAARRLASDERRPALGNGWPVLLRSTTAVGGDREEVYFALIDNVDQRVRAAICNARQVTSSLQREDTAQVDVSDLARFVANAD